MIKERKKIINIYLTQKEFKTLTELKYKYHLSISTISNIITEKVYLLCGKQLEEDYIYTEKGKKTSIKPRNQHYPNMSKVYTNAIKIFINKDLNKYGNERRVQQVNNFIYNELTNTYEENWDGNKFARSLPKFIKNNKCYIRKLLEE